MKKIIVDPFPDANGYFVLRPHDGSTTGNIYAEPIATVYSRCDAVLIAKAVNQMLEKS